MDSTYSDLEEPGDPTASESAADWVGPTPGGSVLLHVQLRRNLLRPAWAGLCGALASGGLAWGSEPLLRLGLLLFLVDLLWGGLWSALASTDWSNPLRHWQRWRHGQPASSIPYATPSGPAGRLAETQGQLKSWWDAELGLTRGSILVGLGSTLALSLLLSALLGNRLLLLTLAAISLSQLVFVLTGGDGRPVPAVQAVLEMGLAWLAGHVLFEPVSASSLSLALLYSLTYAGGLGLMLDQSGLGLWNLGQLGAVVVMVLLRQPWLAGVAGMLWLVQAFPQAGVLDVVQWAREAGEPKERQALAIRYLRYAQPWLMVAMLLAAVAVAVST